MTLTLGVVAASESSGLLGEFDWYLNAEAYTGSGNWLDLSGNDLDAVPAGAVWLDTSAEKCQWGGTDDAATGTSCPDAAALDLTSGFVVAVDVWPADWAPSIPMQLVSKPTGTDGDTNDCYAVGIGTSGVPFIEWHDTVGGHNGPSFTTGLGATATVDFSAATDRKQLVFEFICDNGAGGWTARLYSGTPGATTLLSENVNTTDGAQTLSTSTAPLKIADPFIGRTYRARLYGTLGGALLRDFYPARDWVSGQSMTSGTGEVWSNVLIPTRSGWGVGDDAVLTVADDPLLDIGASDSATVFVVCSTADPTGATFEPIVSKAPAGTGWVSVLYGALGGAVGGAFVAGSPTTDAGPAPSAGVVVHCWRLDRDTDLLEMSTDGVLSGSPVDVSSLGDLSNAGAVTIGGLPMASSYPKSIVIHAVGKINRALTSAEIAQLPTMLGV